ncbi:unnamed protein product [Kuraishia capsulata CBS 1993]|uniref:Uncharacterized protein n=1 Tax=Kuraishia capsulata CBS 1993 TaxID=1382522 RepID=W6MUC2_9ASCO|nr:uncharacterized protein KUCA_T00005109001 [Kuraishia capsulata CBS 1993]CDK29122.1 unnamed protein product [Kuraishia capsulata CBS 1993]
MQAVPSHFASLDAAQKDPVRKCSRCRVKRDRETPEMLEKYQTCLSCREKRKIESRAVKDTLPNLFTDFHDFLERIKFNQAIDILEHNFRGPAPIEFRRFAPEEVTLEIFQVTSKMLVQAYMDPLMNATGFKFPVRDYHKGGSKTKKISFMFICSQDSSRQRKSRSEHKRSVPNKLKVERCESKITLSYDLTDGMVMIYYNHKHHAPYDWKKIPSDNAYPDLSQLGRLIQKETENANEAQAQAQAQAAVELAARTVAYRQPTNTGSSSGSTGEVLPEDMANLLQLSSYLPESHQGHSHGSNSKSESNVDDELKKQDSQASGFIDNIDHELIRESIPK